MLKNLEIENKILRDKYYAEPYNPNDKPLITYLICARVLRGISDKDSLYSLFWSYIEKVPEVDRNKAEFLIKFDVDDEVAIQNWVIGDTLKTKFPNLNIRVFVYNRWEGRRTLYMHYWYLFTRKNPSSKYIGFLTDDVVFLENSIQYIEQHKDSKYAMLSHVHNTEVLHSIKDWQLETTKWSGGTLTEPYPIVSTKILEICGNMGFQPNIDNWFALLNVIMYVKYGIDLYKDIPDLVHRQTFTHQEFDPSIFVPSQFNKEWFVDDSQGSKDSYYYRLVEIQADNIWLNLKNEK